MSRTNIALAANRWAEAQAAESSVLILEKQLRDTLELEWQVQQVRVRSKGVATVKSRLLFDGLANELQRFTDLIRQRLVFWKKEKGQSLELNACSYARPFAVDRIESYEQFETLICSFVHYEKYTSEAMTSLRCSRDRESLALLVTISEAVERCLWFLAAYLEGLALDTESSRLPEWPDIAVSGSMRRSVP